MHWALDGEVPGLAAVVVRPDDADEVAAVLARLQRRPRAGHGGRRAQRRVRRERARARRRRARPMRARRHRRRRRRRRSSSTCAPARSATSLEDELRARPRRHARALAAVDGAVDRRRLARVPGRGPVLDPLRQDRGHGRRPRRRARRRPQDHHRRRAAAGRRPRPHPAVRRLARARSASSPAPGCASIRRPPAERRAACGSPRSPTASTPAGASCAAARRPPCCASTTTLEADRSYQTGDRHVLLVLDEGDPASSTRSCAIVAEECDVPAASALDVGLVDHWLEHRNDVSALEALIRKGFVVDTMEIAAPWRDLPDIYDATCAAIRGVPGTLAASAHQSHAYPDGALPLLHVRGQGRRPTSASAYYLAVWDAGTASRARERRRAQPPPRRRPQPRPVRRARRSAPAFDVLAVGEGGARPERHPQPRQARPARPRSASRGWP